MTNFDDPREMNVTEASEETEAFLNEARMLADEIISTLTGSSLSPIEYFDGSKDDDLSGLTGLSRRLSSKSARLVGTLKGIRSALIASDIL